MLVSNKTCGILSVIAASMCFGTGAIIVKTAFKIQLNSWEFITLQLMFSCFMLLIVYLFRRLKKLEEPLNKEKLIRLGLLGSIGTLGVSVFYVSGFQYIGASMGIVLFYTYPAFTTLGARIFFKERMKLKHCLCLVFTLMGIVFTIDFWTWQLDGLSLRGVFLMLLAALCYTFFTLYGEKSLKNSSSFEITTFTQSFAFLLFIILKPPVFLFQGSVSFYALFLGFIMALLTSVLSYWLILKGINLIGASKVAIISTSEIPFAIFLAIIILGEKLTIFQLIGAVLIICSIVFLDIEGKNTAVQVNFDLSGQNQDKTG